MKHPWFVKCLATFAENDEECIFLSLLVSYQGSMTALVSSKEAASVFGKC